MTKIIAFPGRQVYQCKVTLAGSEPSIWRRFQLSEDSTLHKLHKILQIVMGWEECHLYEFKIDGVSYGEPHPDFGDRMLSSRSIKVSQIADREKKTFSYIYDFGDGWQHQVVVEKISPAKRDEHYPNCVEGAMACPPEDCGGIGGYADLLDAINDPNHEEHDRMLEWIGDEFDPATFDLETVNKQLKRIR